MKKRLFSMFMATLMVFNILAPSTAQAQTTRITSFCWWDMVMIMEKSINNKIFLPITLYTSMMISLYLFINSSLFTAIFLGLTFLSVVIMAINIFKEKNTSQRFKNALLELTYCMLVYYTLLSSKKEERHDYEMPNIMSCVEKKWGAHLSIELKILSLL